MAVNLQKGQKVELRKSNGGDLTKVMVGLGWDEIKQTKGFFLKKNTQEIDCDATALLLQNGKFVSSADMIYFGNLTHESGTVRHMGDNLTGEGEGDDEQIAVDLQRLPKVYDKIVFVVNIFQAKARGQHFGMLQNAFIRICDDNGQELCKYDLNENYNGMTAMVFGELYRHNGAWKFNAIGQATQDQSVHEIANRFR
jgi:stress response protein SCP2